VTYRSPELVRVLRAPPPTRYNLRLSRSPTPWHAKSQRARILNTNLLLRGIVIGFSIAAPVGPIGVLCIRRTLAEGRLSGFVSGLGAATADAIYGCIAGFGLTFISDLLIGQQAWIRLVGGLFLCYLGVKTLLARPSEQAASAQGSGLLGAYGSILFLTLTNPMTILSFMAIFAGLGIADTSGDYGSAAILVLGVFAGSGLWWFLLSGIASVFHARFDARALRWVNRVSGIIIVAFGLVALLSLLLAQSDLSSKQVQTSLVSLLTTRGVCSKITGTCQGQHHVQSNHSPTASNSVQIQNIDT